MNSKKNPTEDSAYSAPSDSVAFETEEHAKRTICTYLEEVDRSKVITPDESAAGLSLMSHITAISIQATPADFSRPTGHAAPAALRAISRMLAKRAALLEEFAI